jgi:hypothetical protein
MENIYEDVLETRCEEFAKIFQTKDISLFGFVVGNRDTDENHIKKLRQSLKKRHIKEVPLIVVRNPTPNDGRPLFFIIDGQHRFKAIIAENLSITFVICESIDYKDENDVISVIEMLNTNDSNWDVTNFLSSKTALSNMNYIRYDKIYKKFGFEHEIIFFLIKKLGDSIDHKKFKSGVLSFDETLYIQVDEILTWLVQYLPIVQKYGKRYYLKALIEFKILKGVDIKRLDDKILNSPNNTSPDFLELTDTIYKSLEYLTFKVYNKGLRDDSKRAGLTRFDSSGSKYRLYIGS